MHRLVSSTVTLLAAFTLSARADTIEVRAADVFNKALSEIGAAFTTSTKHEVKFVFATASVQAKAIEAGAPSNVFVSANQEWMDYVATRKLMVAETIIVPVENGIAIVTPASRSVKMEIKKGFDLAGLIGTDGKFAIGKPDSVPAGIYAKQGLEAMGVWPVVEGRLVIGQSATEARQLVEKGQAAAGAVFATDAHNNPALNTVGMLPAGSHAPSVSPAGVIAKGDTPVARAFVTYLKSTEVQEIWKKYGFSVK
jgi:molybdate transport system substrate-binding protein